MKCIECDKWKLYPNGVKKCMADVGELEPECLLRHILLHQMAMAEVFRKLQQDRDKGDEWRNK